jgi:hypothetical protein
MSLRYLRAAWSYHWNLLFFFGGLAGAALSGVPDALIPIVFATEIAYLAGLSSMPRFRKAIDAKVAAKARGTDDSATATGAQPSLERMLNTLPQASLQRFIAVRQRCYDMREIATGVRGQADGHPGSQSADSIRTPALDRLLFLFLKLLMSQNGLDRFLKSASEPALAKRLEDVRARHLAAQSSGGDERIVRSLQDSVADAELRLDNYRKSMKDAEFVAIELDRIETKIQALTEMAVSRQDPDALSHQVTAAAESMHVTEDAVNQLQHLTGLADQLAEPPSILEADLRGVVTNVR